MPRGAPSVYIVWITTPRCSYHCLRRKPRHDESNASKRRRDRYQIDEADETHTEEARGCGGDSNTHTHARMASVSGGAQHAHSLALPCVVSTAGGVNEAACTRQYEPSSLAGGMVVAIYGGCHTPAPTSSARHVTDVS